tara:strand:- start:3220 stop:4401 length:1182 start_codon:yes stop_codon:yes gene_type:complete
MTETQIPRQVFERETGQTSLREFFRKDEDGDYMNFDSHENRNTCEKKFRIPVHQRFNRWSQEAKIELILSLWMNYATPSIILSQHAQMNNGQMGFYYNIEDGQSRLSVIQEYLDNKFKVCDKLFSECSEIDKNRFLDYSFPTIIISPHRIRAGASCATSIKDHHFENFDRINRGKSLNDNDKYWCKKEKPLVSLAIELMENCKTDYTFMKTEKFNTEDSKGRMERKPLEEFVTILSAILNNVYKKSYSRHFMYIGNAITDEHRGIIEEFMSFYKSIHDDMFEQMPKRHKEYPPKFNNPGQFLGMIIMDWKDTDSERTMVEKKNMWVDILNIDRCSHNFMKGKNSLFNDFTDGDKKNQEQENIRKRLVRVKEFYSNKQNISNLYRIEYEENDSE